MTRRTLSRRAGWRAGRPEIRRGRATWQAGRLLAGLLLTAGSVAALTAPAAQASPAGAARPAAATRLTELAKVSHAAGQAGRARQATGRSGLWRPATGAAGVALIPGRAAPASGTWRTQSTPNPGTANGSLAADSCVPAASGTAATCVAAGYYLNDKGEPLLLAVADSGAGWRRLTVPEPAGSIGAEFNGVSCTSAKACVAAGLSDTRAGSVPLAEVWNGSTWRITSAPVPPDSAISGFLGVSCATATACTAVGDLRTDGTGMALTLAERWNGTTWAVQKTANPAGAAGTGLFAVSCPTASACVAAGNAENSQSQLVTTAERWNGSSWTELSPRTPSGAQSATLTGVACTAASTCTAVGYDGNGSSTVNPLAERWTGSSWTVQATPAPAGTQESALSAVSCPTASACTAAGSYQPSGSNGSLTLAEHWNGTKWAIQATPSPSSAAASQLLAVACPSASSCTAAGFGASSGGTSQPLAEHGTSGSWAIQATPRPYGALNNSLLAVSCPARDDCTAVGDNTRADTAVVTLAEHWNGTGWQVQPTPDPAGATASYLQAVVCHSASACVAVGFYLNAAGESFPLAEIWTGTAWKLSSVTAGNNASLNALSCPTASACTAVGNNLTRSGDGRALAEHWNGSTWSQQTVAQPGQASYLFGVSCPSAADCTAAGFTQKTSGEQVPLAETWTGSGWKTQPLPVPGSAASSNFGSVSCTAASACEAIGDYLTTSGDSDPFAARWNGSAWTLQQVPAPPASLGAAISMTGISCAAATFCTAVGFYGSIQQPAGFAEAWRNGTWAAQTTTVAPDAVTSLLTGVSCTGGGCTAVGSQSTAASVTVTLADVTGS